MESDGKEKLATPSAEKPSKDLWATPFINKLVVEDDFFFPPASAHMESESENPQSQKGGGGQDNRQDLTKERKKSEASKSENPQSQEVYACLVQGLAYSTNEQALKTAFIPFGEVIDSKIICDRYTGRSKGYGFVTFKYKKSMKDAIEALNGENLDGRTITIQKACGSGGGGGGGYRGGFGGRGGRGEYSREREGCIRMQQI